MQVGKQPSPEQTTPQLERQAVTQLLKRLSAGDRDAFDHLVPLVYDQLRRLASRSLRSQRPDHTLRATALVHEAYLRLADAGGDWQDSVHFYAVAARVMGSFWGAMPRQGNARTQAGAQSISRSTKPC